MKLRCCATIISVAMGLTSCSESGPTGDEPSGSFHATIQGTEGTITYLGTGSFVTGLEVRGPSAHRFQLYSRGLGESEGHSIGLYRFGAEVPAVGVYELGPVDPQNPVGFVAYHHRRSAEGLDSYVSLTGDVLVSLSTADRVEGTLSITAAQYCSLRADNSSWCVSPLSAMGNRQIEIAGSFVAERQNSFAGEIQ